MYLVPFMEGVVSFLNLPPYTKMCSLFDFFLVFLTLCMILTHLSANTLQCFCLSIFL